MKDYEFAKKEFDNAGVSFTPDIHKALVASFSQLEKATVSLFGPKYKLRWVSIGAPNVPEPKLPK